ncbi:DUF4268 domain-containing protein [Thiocapsa roseopersicina]|uniref:DUF4268 domain-containing protein n=1 Tax=Thiocapsa roseopersicina TaxID=1058 RepID=A0A1H3DNF8_THIRO|nr:DUF4268 domain-containing protein [Thiocapsa roseopersicina]SDX68043.1 protein of unknown function [Thiocapsa roseopersicina]
MPVDNPLRLARLEPMDLRCGWPHEAGAFTPWLAAPENLALLGDTLGLRLVLDGSEVNVGIFRADLLCRDQDDGLVLIENQLERTDHSHLGQILTYVAGLKAQTTIWIAAAFTEEHRAALDWLNDATDERYHFFGLTIELWRIGGSLPAPRFNLVVKPNDWSRAASRVVRSVQSGELSEVGRRRLAYWTGFQQFLAEHPCGLTLDRVAGSANLGFPTAHPGLTLKLYRSVDEIGVFLRVHGEHATERYEHLLELRAELEGAFGAPLVWMVRSDGAFYWIVRTLRADPDDQEDWPRQFQFIVDAVMTFTRLIDERRWDLV